MAGEAACHADPAACCGGAATAGGGCSGAAGAIVTSAAPAPTAAPAKKRVIARGRGTVPASILQNEMLNKMIESLPSNYTFEMHKTVWRIQESGAKRVALQFPEGLLLFAPVIASIIERFIPGVTCVILGDVTYGACCVDDWASRALGADFLVHYGHSCLVSIKDCVVPHMMYVFVEIKVDVEHCVETIKKLIPKERKVLLAGTIQFASCLRAAAAALKEHFTTPPTVPQTRPLSFGEVLGCTSPKVPAGEHDTLVFLADGRFHMESLMIHNPTLAAYLYNPYTKVLTEEGYDHKLMQKNRTLSIESARGAKKWGVILGTLGHQGSPAALTRVEAILDKHDLDYCVVLLSEIFPAKLALFKDVDAWVQISCPRLSIDWGQHFDKPLLTPFEFEVCMGKAVMPSVYPMDWYSKDGGPWAVYTDKSAPL